MSAWSSKRSATVKPIGTWAYSTNWVGGSSTIVRVIWQSQVHAALQRRVRSGHCTPGGSAPAIAVAFRRPELGIPEIFDYQPATAPAIYRPVVELLWLQGSAEADASSEDFARVRCLEEERRVLGDGLRQILIEQLIERGHGALGSS